MIVTVDMPFVNAKKVKLGYSEDNVLEVYAETSRTITFKALGAKHRHGEFKSYHARIRLPVRINDKKITSRFKRGVLELHLPRVK